MYICIIDNTCLCYWYIFSFKYISQWYLHPKLRNGTLLLKCFEVTFIFQRIYYFRPMSSFKIFKCLFRASWVIIHSFFSLISNGCILFYFWHVQCLQETFKTEPNHSNVLIGFPGFFIKFKIPCAASDYAWNVCFKILCDIPNFNNSTYICWAKLLKRLDIYFVTL